MIISHEADDEEAYAAASERNIAEALTLAKEETDRGSIESLGSRSTAIVVWEGRSRGEEDLTAGFAALARKNGMQVLEINTLRVPE